jgi:hypothetical protein
MKNTKRIRLNAVPKTEDEADEWYKAIENNTTSNYDVRIYNEVKEYVRLLKEYSYKQMVDRKEDARSCWKRDHGLPEDFPITIESICSGPFEYEYKITCDSLTARVTQTNFYTVDSVLIEDGLSLDELDSTIPAHKALSEIIKDMWNSYETFNI